MSEKMYLILTLVMIPLLAGYVYMRRPKKLKNSFYVGRWRLLQTHCRTKDNWPLALKEADILLNNALRKRRYKGKTVGARLMAAQRDIKDNDGIWFAHNLTKKTLEDLNKKGAHILTKKLVKDALESYKDALSDLGALRRAPDKE